MNAPAGNSEVSGDARKRVVIVGGGSTGWIAAAALGRQLRTDEYDVVLIESSDIGTIGVGEAVIPPFVTFIRNLGLNEQDFIRKTQASFKLGIQFRNWLAKDHAYFHHFGALGRELDGHDFLQCWLKARSLGDDAGLMDYAPAAVMAKFDKFFLPFKMPPESPLTGAAYAFHFDAGLVGQYLRAFAEDKGVRRIDARIVNVHLADDGAIRALELDDGSEVGAELFLDCSGFRGLLTEEALQTPYESWLKYLPCDKAVALQTAHHGAITPYTISTARDAGWTWRIPLQHRIGNGYVFSSAHCSDETAVDTLVNAVEGEPLHEPRVIPFRTGMREALWAGNCVALGLAGGFLEPLESTAIHIVTRGVQFLLELFPNLEANQAEWQHLADEYNARMRRDYEEIRDFIILHYCTTRRDDTAYWRHCAELPLPGSLEEKIALFAERGELRIIDDGLFKKPSWQAVFTGMDVIPRRYHPFVDMSDFDRIHAAMQAGRDHLAEVVQTLPSHRAFLAEHCPADPDPMQQ